jgi:hypothetical protein
VLYTHSRHGWLRGGADAIVRVLLWFSVWGMRCFPTVRHSTMRCHFVGMLRRGRSELLPHSTGWWVGHSELRRSERHITTSKLFREACGSRSCISSTCWSNKGNYTATLPLPHSSAAPDRHHTQNPRSRLKNTPTQTTQHNTKVVILFPQRFNPFSLALISPSLNCITSYRRNATAPTYPRY